MSANLYFSFSVAWTRRTPNRNGRSQCKCCSTITANCSHSGATTCSSTCEIAFLKSVKVQTSDEINSAKQVKWEECHCEQLEYLSFFYWVCFGSQTVFHLPEKTTAEPSSWIAGSQQRSGPAIYNLAASSIKSTTYNRIKSSFWLRSDSGSLSDLTNLSLCRIGRCLLPKTAATGTTALEALDDPTLLGLALECGSFHRIGDCRFSVHRTLPFPSNFGSWRFKPEWIRIFECSLGPT